MKTRTVLSVLALALVPSAIAAFVVGGIAYTKRLETKLLAEPNALADVAARVGFERTLKVEEIRGRWLRVSEGKARGWVYDGNVSEEKIVETRGLDGLSATASDTTATAAARPLAPAAVEYGARKGLAKASEELKWLEATSDAITADDVRAFLVEHKKGEFQ